MRSKKAAALAIILALTLGVSLGAQKNGRGGGGGGSNGGLQTQIFDFCQMASATGETCHILSDNASQGWALYSDSNLIGGDSGITLEFSRSDYVGTYRASSQRRAWVAIDSSGCQATFQGRLRFLRIDDMDNMVPGESRTTGAYAQIDGSDGLIWNLFWSDGSVQVDRDVDSGVWNTYTRSADSVEIQTPGGRKKWETCDTNATVHFDLNIIQP